MSGPIGEALDMGVIEGLRASVEGDTAFVIELIDAFLADSATQLQAIDIAVTAGDPEAVVRPAHTLKSASATLGAMQLSAAAGTLETAGRAGSIDGAEAREAAAEIPAAWDAAAAALRAWSADQDR